MSSFATVPLDNIFEIARGGSPRPIDKFITDDPEGVNWIMIGDASASSKYIEKTKKKIRQEGVSRSRTVHPGDFLLTNSMSFGRPYILKTSGCIHDGWLVLSPKTNEVDPNYFYHLLGSDTIFREFSRRAAGATVKNLNIELVKGVEVPVPPLNDQRRIAGILDEADELRRKRQRSIELLSNLGQAIFYEMFGDPQFNPMGWETSHLGSICDVGSSKRVFVNELVERGVPFYRGTEIGKLGNGEKIEPSLFITTEHYEKLKAQSGVPNKRDLLLPSICPDGRIYEVEDNRPFYFKDGRVLWIKVDGSRIDSTFLKYHLKQLFFADYSKIASGTTFAELKIFALKDLSIQVPPMEQQKRFTAIVESIERQKSCFRAHFAQLGRLFSSLQQRAFAGEL